MGMNKVYKSRAQASGANQGISMIFSTVSSNLS